MKKIFLTLIVLVGLAIPWACSKNNNPISPAPTATPIPTATTWANYTATNTPTSTATSTPTATNISGYTSTFTATVTSTATATSTATNANGFTSTITFTPTSTTTTTGTVTATPVDTPYNSASFGPSVIQYPNGLALGSNGNIYVAQGDGSSNSSLQILNSSLNSTGSINSFGVTAFGNLDGVATNSAGTTLYTVDSVNDAVYVFTSGGTPVTSWSSWSSSSGPTSFLNPEGIAVDSGGNIYVADTGNDEVEEFSSPGSSVTEWSGGSGSFSNPSAVAIDSSNNLYVADASHQAVQIFNVGGSSWTSWTTNIAGYYPSAGYNPSDVYGITVDNNNNVYVADVANGLVEVYANSGGAPLTVLNGPNADFIDPDGVLILPGSSPATFLVTDYTGPDPNGTGSLQEFVP